MSSWDRMWLCKHSVTNLDWVLDNFHLNFGLQVATIWFRPACVCTSVDESGVLQDRASSDKHITKDMKKSFWILIALWSAQVICRPRKLSLQTPCKPLNDEASFTVYHLLVLRWAVWNNGNLVVKCQCNKIKILGGTSPGEHLRWQNTWQGQCNVKMAWWAVNWSLFHTVVILPVSSFSNFI